MSAYQSCLLIITSSLCGWLIHSAYIKLIFRPYSAKRFLGFKYRGLLPKMQEQLSGIAASKITETYLTEKKIAEKARFDLIAVQLKPQIETLIDAFLAEKLPTAFPMLANLMGAKTLSKFKTAFMEEMDSRMPALVSTAGSMLMRNINPEATIEKVIREIPIPQLEKSFRQYAKKELLRFKLMGAIAGLLVGLLQCLILTIFT